MAEQELNSMTTHQLLEKYKELLGNLEANFYGQHNYKTFMRDGILCLKILGILQERILPSEVHKPYKEVTNAEAIRSSEESSSTDA